MSGGYIISELVYSHLWAYFDVEYFLKIFI